MFIVTLTYLIVKSQELGVALVELGELAVDANLQLVDVERLGLASARGMNEGRGFEAGLTVPEVVSRYEDLQEHLGPVKTNGSQFKLLQRHDYCAAFTGIATNLKGRNGIRGLHFRLLWRRGHKIFKTATPGMD